MVKAKLSDSDSAGKTVERLALTGKAARIINVYNTAERVVNDHSKAYLPILQGHAFKPGQVQLDDPSGYRQGVVYLDEMIAYRQLENTHTLAQNCRALTQGKGQIAWDGAFSLARQHYSGSITPGSRLVFPFVEDSQDRWFFEKRGADKKPGQQKYGESLVFNNQKLVVADYGTVMGALMLDLLDQGFPHAEVPGKVSRVFIDNGKTNAVDRLAALPRHLHGVDDDYSFAYPTPDAFVGLSPESQR